MYKTFLANPVTNNNYENFIVYTVQWKVWQRGELTLFEHLAKESLVN